ncbi:BLUF domain-containing protein [Gayadomonas joobiniege]|uniref:BLUF domain-containing protein n=1 Tax=Gayadomonas joobiniege TaxID=1234606 RepID=UPI0003653B68|nr:BLUF domain-containing protein [Gayadomonas joobiniege]
MNTFLPNDVIYQINYWSKASQPMSRLALEALAKDAEQNNQKHDITGVLLFGAGMFFQCLEGPSDKVIHLFNKIKQDPRHYDITLVSQECHSERFFSQWSMGFTRLPNPSESEQFKQIESWRSQTLLAAPIEVRRLLLSYATPTEGVLASCIH